MDKLELLLRKQITINEEIIEKLNFDIAKCQNYYCIVTELGNKRLQRDKLFNENLNFFWVIEKIHMIQQNEGKKH